MLKFHKSGAFTLIELLVAMMVLYLACAYLMSLFSSGWRWQARNREYSMALALARSQMELLACSPVERLGGSSSGNFEEPYGGYAWKAKVSSYKGELKLLTLEVTSPCRAKAQLQRLVRGRSFLGVSCDENCDQVVWAGENSTALSWKTSSSATVRSLSLKLGTEKHCWGGAYGVPGRGIVWTADASQPIIGYFAFGTSTTPLKQRSLSAPTKTNWSVPLFAGIAGDSWGNRLYCADVANGAVWVACDEEGRDSLRWSNSSPLRPQQLPLEEPMGVALDENASILWIAEGGAHALRPLYLNTEISPSGLGAEKISGYGSWGPRYAPPKGTGMLGGVAVNKWSSAVYTVDNANLHVLIYRVSSTGVYSSSWSSYTLPSALQEALPSGIACDPYNDIVYINTRQGKLWRGLWRSGRWDMEKMQ